MNLGIYVDNVARINNLNWVEELINTNISNGNIVDASIFYDDVVFVSRNIKCGRFNSADLWNFSGTIITPNISCLDKIKNIVNNIKIIYYYGFEESVPLFLTIKAINSCDKIICKTKKDSDYLYRISGKRINETSENINNLLEMIK